MIILLAFFNDVPIMAIAYDNAWLDPKPVRWDMRRVLTVSTVLGLSRPFSSPVLLCSAIVTKVLATLFVLFPFGLITPIGWSDAGIVWIYCIVWIFIEDRAKLAVYKYFNRSSSLEGDYPVI